jgi:hypothetical protein
MHDPGRASLPARRVARRLGRSLALPESRKAIEPAQTRGESSEARGTLRAWGTRLGETHCMRTPSLRHPRRRSSRGRSRAWGLPPPRAGLRLAWWDVGVDSSHPLGVIARLSSRPGEAPLERLEFGVDREGEAPSEPGFPRLGRSLALPENGFFSALSPALRVPSLRGAGRGNVVRASSPCPRPATGKMPVPRADPSPALRAPSPRGAGRGGGTVATRSLGNAGAAGRDWRGP